MTRTIIMISGKAGSGKDYIANWLVKNKGFKRFAFGDHLKDIVSYRYNIKRSLFDTQEGKKITIVSEGQRISLRDLLISTAKSERHKNNSVFIDKVKTDIERSCSDKIVISDFRYPLEYDSIKKYFCNHYYQGLIYTLKVESNSFTIVNDPSETQLSNFEFDKTIRNCKTLDFNNTLSCIFREY